MRWNGAGKDQLDQAEQAKRNAIALDPELALAYYADGLIHRARGEHHAAFEAFRHAVKLNPNFARADAQEGDELVNIGRPLEAPALVDAAISLSPLDPSLGQFYWIKGRAHFFAGDYQDAITWLQKSVEVRSNLWYNRLYLVSAYELSGDAEQAKRVLRDFYSRTEFKGYTLSRVETAERANPNDDPVVVGGRQKFRSALLAAGLPQR